jgi:hypothetical protein
MAIFDQLTEHVEGVSWHPKHAMKNHVIDGG